jgi:hypothetical protein
MTGNSVRVGSGAVPAQVNRQAVSEVMHSLVGRHSGARIATRSRSAGMGDGGRHRSRYTACPPPRPAPVCPPPRPASACPPPRPAPAPDHPPTVTPAPVPEPDEHQPLAAAGCPPGTMMKARPKLAKAKAEWNGPGPGTPSSSALVFASIGARAQASVKLQAADIRVRWRGQCRRQVPVA